MTRLSMAILCLTAVFILCGCGGNESRWEVNLSSTDVPEVNIKRYGKALFSADTAHLVQELKGLQEGFLFFLGGDLDDPDNVERIRNYVSDTVLREVANDVITAYPHLDDLEIELTEAFRHFRYHYPSLRLPSVYSYISGLDYENRIALVDSVLIIAIDLYLGSDYEKYSRAVIPGYIIRRLEKKYIVPDCMREMGESLVRPEYTGNTLLDQAVRQGKILCFMQAMQPGQPDSVIMGYTEAQMDWAASHEADMWGFIIENRFLYTSDMMVIRKFVQDGPFTSFFGNESPPRLGWWIGWKIVKAYLDKRPETELKELLNIYDAQEMLRVSGYKPSKM